MNKKQLSLQNSSLFAELERKAKEIEILNIRLEDSEKKSATLKSENDQLRNGIKEANFEIKNLNSKLKILKEEYENQIQLLTDELEKTKESAIKPIIPVTPPETITYKEPVASNNEEPLEDYLPEELIAANIIEESIINKPEETAVFEPEENPVSEPEEVTAPEPIIEAAEPDITENKAETIEKPIEANPPIAPTEPIIPTTPADASAPITDLLRDHGAKIIGKVTRVTAEVISKINTADEDAAASLKTLALGKNESFKFKIMELAKKGGDLERVMAEMEFLADETIIYLRSI